MRYLVLSDLHANIQALDAVLADAQAIGYDEVLVLGDLVGYGADPIEVVDRTLALGPTAIVRGNHDKVCAGLEPADAFNDVARMAAEWTTSVLDTAHLDSLRQLPRGPVRVTPEIEICHGAPFDEDYYVIDESDAEQALASAGARICLFGHTHVVTLFATMADPFGEQTDRDGEYRLPSRGPALINVGSVGQPRDRDPRAAYGILDTDRATIWLRRAAYDIRAAQERILQAGLPVRLALRLEQGL
jgi:predicted phosphodiesterase